MDLFFMVPNYVFCFTVVKTIFSWSCLVILFIRGKVFYTLQCSHHLSDGSCFNIVLQFRHHYLFTLYKRCYLTESISTG